MAKRITAKLRREHDELHARWRNAARAIETSVYGSTDAQDAAEQATYDTLVDWVEANELAYSELDPRGTEDPTDDELRGHKL